MVDKAFICRALGVEHPKHNKEYRAFRVAQQAKENDVAFLDYFGKRKSEEELADLAIEKGATLLVSTKQIKDYPCLIVDNVREAWIQISSAQLEKNDVRTVGITGSIGKTTTKEFLVSILNSYKLITNYGNQNVACEVGKSIQKLTTDHEFYVQEVCEGPPIYSATTISKMINPNVSVITKISESHLETFGNIENITKSTFGIVNGMTKNDVLIINADDPYQIDYKTDINTITYGILNPESHYRAINIKSTYDVYNLGIDFDIEYEDKIVQIHINFFGEHNVYCALAAFVAAKKLGLSDDEIRINILKSKPKKTRSNLINVGSNSLYVDCYNANYESIKAALKTLALLDKANANRKFKRIAVLSDIAESGDGALQMHKNVGKAVIDSNIDVVICYGELASNIAEVVKSESSINVYSTTDIKEVVGFLKEVVEQDDIVLFKGSRSFVLELAVDKAFGTNIYEKTQGKTKKEDVVVQSYRATIFPNAGYSRIQKYTGKNKNIQIPNSLNNFAVETIGKLAFAKNRNLEAIRLPTSVIRIDKRAFYKCTNLKYVELSEELRIICEEAFQDCGKLRSIKLPHSIIEIQSKAFINCVSLDEISIPPSVSSICDNAFENCDKITIIGVKNSYVHNYAQKHGIKFLSNFHYTKDQLIRKVKSKLEKRNNNNKYSQEIKFKGN